MKNKKGLFPVALSAVLYVFISVTFIVYRHQEGRRNTIEQIVSLILRYLLAEAICDCKGQGGSDRHSRLNYDVPVLLVQIILRTQMNATPSERKKQSYAYVTSLMPLAFGHIGFDGETNASLSGVYV